MTFGLHGVALAIATVLGLLAGLHVYWAAGGRRGQASAVPERDGAPLFVPSVAATLTVAGLLAASAAIVLVHGLGLASGAVATLARVGCFGLGGVFLARASGDFRFVGVFKRVRGTRFARLDDRLYSPLCLLLGVAALALAVCAGGAKAS